MKNQRRQMVAASWEVNGHTAQLVVETYDPTLPLIVDPEMLVFSERLLRIAGEGSTPIISEAQERRVRAQCLGVANYYRVLDLHHPEVEAVDCAAIAAAWSGSICSGWTIYRWSLEYVENSGKFLSDGRVDFDRDCFITSNEDIKRDLRDWMRAHLQRAQALFVS